jgi:hypothetical protein
MKIIKKLKKKKNHKKLKKIRNCKNKKMIPLIKLAIKRSLKKKMICTIKIIQFLNKIKIKPKNMK